MSPSSHTGSSAANSRIASSRSGFVQVTILLFVVPLLVFAALALLQLTMLRTAQQRVLAAAREGAECACRSGSLDDVHRSAGLTLGYLGGDYQTELDFIDTDGDSSDDSAAVGVTIPMNAVSTNYLGLFCGAHVDGLRLRQVVVLPCVFAGEVLFDVSSPPHFEQDCAWGINFAPLEPGDLTDLKIEQVVIDLLPPGNNDTGNDAQFDFFGPNAPDDCANVTDAPLISDSMPDPKVDHPPPGGAMAPVSMQADVFGLNFVDSLVCSEPIAGEFHFANDQVEFIWVATDPSKLIINFSANGGDDGFEPGDRIRFGAKVKDLSDDSVTPNNENGDEVGRVGVQVTVTFSVGGVPQAPASTAIFIDSNFRGMPGNHPAGLDPTDPANLPFVLPLAPSSGNGNDGQSYVLLERQ